MFIINVFGNQNSHIITLCFKLDSIACMDVWVLDGVEYQEQLLQYVLSREKCLNTLVVIVVDLSQPWEVMDSLERWTEVVRTHLDSLSIPPKEFADMRDAGKQTESVVGDGDKSMAIIHCTPSRTNELFTKIYRIVHFLHKLTVGVLNVYLPICFI